MKHYILLSVRVPSPVEDDKYAKWRDLAQRLELLEKSTKGIVRLGEGVWLRFHEIKE